MTALYLDQLPFYFVQLTVRSAYLLLPIHQLIYIRFTRIDIKGIYIKEGFKRKN